MKKLTKKQEFIVNLIQERGLASTQEILKRFTNTFDTISRQTLIRILNNLIEERWLIREGKGRGIHYRTLLATPLLSYIDPEKYFKIPPDERKTLTSHFNWDVFEHFEPIFSKDELLHLHQINEAYKKNIQKLSSTLLRKEWERLTIELAWKSSQIEGNTYSLIDTEILLKEHKEAKGHSAAEAQMILNHKETLNYIFNNAHYFQKLSVQKIEEIHRLLVHRLNVGHGLRKRLVGITGTVFKPLDNQHQIKEAMEKTVKLVNRPKDPFSKALITILLLSYIQAFEDGNKRTSRMVGNALLYSYDVCPLSYRSVDEAEYKKATLLFYEQNSASYFKELFVEQFEFAVRNYF